MSKDLSEKWGKITYTPGSILDLIIESYAGIHDYLGGDLVGGYDDEGNQIDNQAPKYRALQNVWTSIAILPSTPFALSSCLPRSIFDTLTYLLK